MLQSSGAAPEALKRRLDTGEALLWWGMPKRGILFRRRDLLLVPFSLLWGGFAIFWESLALTHGAPLFFALFGLPFVVIGLYFIGGRFVHDAWRRARTFYGVTPERVVIVSGDTVQSLSLRQLPETTLQEKSDGSGFLTFGSAALPFGGMANPWSGKPAVPTFEAIPDAGAVHDLIRRTQAQIARRS